MKTNFFYGVSDGITGTDNPVGRYHCVCKVEARYALLADLPWRHHSCCLPCSAPFRLFDLALAFCPDLPHGPVDQFPIFMVDRFNSVPIPVYLLLQALVLKPSVACALSPHLESL
ncbi:unnamed protein product [Protopolystoma xenopodis]|uniref:Uncharacterized protein n=1 Tax=Protopolystoma xenopodis TaxID=117903 RepID=A0A3S5C5E0_9PLAT|nr:unnamed protein product [Protopolystoma xenopodis]